MEHGLSATIEHDLQDRFTVTPEHQQQFREQGYIKLKQVLCPETLAHFGEIVTAEVLRRNTQSKPMAERDTYSKAFLQVTNLWRDCEAVQPFVFSRKLAQIAGELMGVTGVRLYHDQALYKEPGGGHTPWHADQYYWPLSNDHTVTVWVPLQATSKVMGPLAFAPTSHRIEVGRDIAISDASEQILDKTIKQTIAELDDGPFELGEVSYHLGWTFHRAGANTTNLPRRVMTMIYMDADIRVIAPKRKEHQADWDAFMPGIAVGEVAASPLNPLLWSSRA
jgi:ectoine hydroxylase-related dioxygenase (phytanoyl-CoA dioxygenase family)